MTTVTTITRSEDVLRIARLLDNELTGLWRNDEAIDALTTELVYAAADAECEYRATYRYWLISVCTYNRDLGSERMLLHRWQRAREIDLLVRPLDRAQLLALCRDLMSEVTHRDLRPAAFAS